MSSLKVYWTDPLQIQFEVVITGCQKIEENFQISIDCDVIRPEGGGQAGDKGKIKTQFGEVEVIDTISTDDGVRLVSANPVEVGEKATLIINQHWRRNMMRNHTSEHLFVSELKKLQADIELGYIWIDGEKGTVEILGNNLGIDLLLTAERNVQQYIFEDRYVETRIIDASDLSPGIRAREGVESQHQTLRIVSVEGIDEAACSGLHVLRTGDIGVFKILDYKIEREKARIEFTSYENALSALSSVYNSVMKRKKEFPFEMHQIGFVLDKAKKTADAKEDLLRLLIHLIDVSSAPDVVAGISFKHYKIPGFDIRDLRSIPQSISHKDSSALLLFSPGEKSNFIFWTTGLEHEAESYVSEITKMLGGKGGGSRDVYTGGFGNVENPNEIYDKLVEGIKTRLQS